MFILDFDDTLFDNFQYKEKRRQAALNFGVPRDVFDKTYSEARNSNEGYNDEGHARLLADEGFDFDALLKILEKTRERVSEHVFFDAPDFLNDLKAYDKLIILMTLGSPDYQRRVKIERAGLSHFFDEIVYTNGRKVEAVKELIRKYPNKKIYFINDKPKETEEVIRNFPLIKPIMKVSPSFDREEYDMLGYPYFYTLTEIKQYVRSQLEQSGSGDIGGWERQENAE